MACSGNSVDHCCYVAGGVCPHLEEGTVPGRFWSCGLRRELVSWEAVHADSRYQADVRARLPASVGDCGDWPPPGVTCGACGVVG